MELRRLADTRLVAFLSVQGIEPVRSQLTEQGNKVTVVYEFCVNDKFNRLCDTFFEGGPVSISPSALLKRHSGVMYKAKQLKLEAGLNRPIVAGVVERFDPATGWGFVRCPEVKEEVFLHVQDVVVGNGLCVGCAVTFELVQTEKGAKALNIRIVEKDSK